MSVVTCRPSVLLSAKRYAAANDGRLSALEWLATLKVCRQE